ncbi:MAG TPA: TadE family protein [Terriglobales bacterium]|jgi:hypothetical protein
MVKLIGPAGLRSKLGDNRGAEIAEAAAVLPLLVMLIFGIIWFGRAFSIYTTLTRAAREAAIAAAARSCATCGNTLPSDATIRTTIVEPILNSAHIDPAQLVFDPIQHDQILNPGSTPTVSGVVVSLHYPYNFKLNSVTCCPFGMTTLRPGITISASSEAREEN